MPYLNRRNLPMKTLRDFERLVKAIRREYVQAISEEAKRSPGLNTSWARDLRREQLHFEERVRLVLDDVGDVPDTTRLTGDALERARHMLLIGH